MMHNLFDISEVRTTKGMHLYKGACMKITMVCTA